MEFEILRQKLYKAPVYAHPEGLKDFVVYCNASITSLGMNLMKRGRFIDYASKSGSLMRLGIPHTI